MTKIRVLVVEDSLTVRKRLVEVLAGDPDLEVVAEAPDGQRAIELCQSLRPDVMTLDMMLPHDDRRWRSPSMSWHTALRRF